LIRRPLFRGTSELDQLVCIMKTLLPNDEALPSREDWPEFRALLDKVYPSGFPSLADSSRQPGLGSLRNFFGSLP